jgi:hypothetical protein
MNYTGLVAALVLGAFSTPASRRRYTVLSTKISIASAVRLTRSIARMALT